MVFLQFSVHPSDVAVLRCKMFVDIDVCVKMEMAKINKISEQSHLDSVSKFLYHIDEHRRFD